MENADVSVANATSTINTANSSVPNGIFWNTAGSTIKIKLGPASGLKPSANTAGKITKPDSKETSIFNHIMLFAERNRSCLLSKYEA